MELSGLDYGKRLYVERTLELPPKLFVMQALGSDWDGSIDAHFDVTGLPLMVQALEKEGFTKEDIEKIMGGNIRDFFLRNLPD